MPEFLEQLQYYQQRTRRSMFRQCRLGVMLDKMNAQLRKQVEAALENPEYLHKPIALALTDEGYEVSRDIVGHHRRKKCICYRDTTNTATTR